MIQSNINYFDEGVNHAFLIIFSRLTICQFRVLLVADLLTIQLTKVVRATLSLHVLYQSLFK